jgi:putative copper export protein
VSAPSRRERPTRASRWSVAAGWTGAVLLVAAALMAARPSRADRREILGRYSPEYAIAIAVIAMASAWWAGGLRGPKSA